MLEDILNNIIAYIEFLQDNFGFFITIHGNSGFISHYMYKLAPYNIHRNPYCLLVKSGQDIWDKCRSEQKKVVAKCAGGIFSGVCHAGVLEYVIPVTHSGKCLGFISVSGYKGDLDKAITKIDRLCNEFHLNKETILKGYELHLTSAIPNPKLINAIMPPLAGLFELLFIYHTKIYGEKFGNTSTTDYMLGNILSYIEFNYRNDIKLIDICKSCHCSLSHLSHLFKSRVGVSVGQYIDNMRLTEAKRLLTQSELSIKEIAFMLGYNDSNYFSNRFKKAYEISPSGFRLKKRNC